MLTRSDVTPVLWITPKTLRQINNGFPMGQRLDVSVSLTEKYSIPIFLRDYDLAAADEQGKG